MPNDVTEGLFATVVEALPMGRFICEYPDKVAYEYLQKEAYREYVNDYLAWLYRLMAEYSAMSELDRAIFDVQFPGDVSAFFDGNYYAEDVVICPR